MYLHFFLKTLRDVSKGYSQSDLCLGKMALDFSMPN